MSNNKKKSGGIDIKDEIEKAIEGKRTISCDYHEFHRVIEPHHDGLLGGKDQVHCYQTEGDSESESGNPPGWRNFVISEIENLEINEDGFSVRGDHNPSGSKYSKIYKSVEE